LLKVSLVDKRYSLIIVSKPSIRKGVYKYGGGSGGRKNGKEKNKGKKEGWAEEVDIAVGVTGVL